MRGHDDEESNGAVISSMVKEGRPARRGTSPPLSSHITPLQDYLVKTGKDHYFTYRSGRRRRV